VAELYPEPGAKYMAFYSGAEAKRRKLKQLHRFRETWKSFVFISMTKTLFVNKLTIYCMSLRFNLHSLQEAIIYASPF
jgi:hypothetical protein